MDEKSSNNNIFKSYLDDFIPAYDEFLTNSSVEICDRQMRSAIAFVDICVVDIKGCDKENFLSSDVFTHNILTPIYDWYYEKYGDLTKRKVKETMRSMLLVHGQPVLLEIPTTITEIEKEGETLWLTFPRSLNIEETIESMLKIDINSIQFSEEELESINEEFSQKVGSNRNIFVNLMTSSKFDSKTSNLVKSIDQHLENAVQSILTNRDPDISSGLWDIHLAVEKALKGYLKQLSGNFPNIHDLRKLREKIKEFDSDIDLSIIDQLPSGGDAIKYRYGELISSSKSAYSTYSYALKLIECLTSKYKKGIHMNGDASFKLKMAPYAR